MLEIDVKCFEEYLTELAENEDFKQFLKMLYSLCIFMELND